MAKQQFRLFDKNGKEQPIDADRIQDELDQMQSIGYQLREVGTLRAGELRARLRTEAKFYETDLSMWVSMKLSDLEAIVDSITVQPREEEVE